MSERHAELKAQRALALYNVTKAQSKMTRLNSLIAEQERLKRDALASAPDVPKWHYPLGARVVVNTDGCDLRQAAVETAAIVKHLDCAVEMQHDGEAPIVVPSMDVAEIERTWNSLHRIRKAVTDAIASASEHQATSEQDALAAMDPDYKALVEAYVDPKLTVRDVKRLVREVLARRHREEAERDPDLYLRIVWRCNKCGREREERAGYNEGGKCSCGGEYEEAGETYRA